MPDVSEPIIDTAPAPVVDTSAADLMAAFSAATQSPPPQREAPAPEPVAVPAPVVEAAAPVPVVEVVAPVAPVVPDYAAYLKETFGSDTADALKERLTLAGKAESLQANQRTAQDLAFEKLLANPAAATAFVKLQSTDFSQVPAKELLAAKYAFDHPELSPEVAAIRARREYDAEYAAAEFDDPDDPAVQEAKVLLNAATKEAITTMEAAKSAATAAVMAKAIPEAVGPTAEQKALEADNVAQSAHWMQGVESIVAAPSLELEYTVDGQPMRLAFDNKNAAFKEAMLNPVEWLLKELRPAADWKQTNYDRLAEIIALATQPDVLLKNAIATGKASLGAVIPLDRAVNPTPNAPQSPTANMSVLDAFRQATDSQRNRSTQY